MRPDNRTTARYHPQPCQNPVASACNATAGPHGRQITPGTATTTGVSGSSATEGSHHGQIPAKIPRAPRHTRPSCDRTITPRRDNTTNRAGIQSYPPAVRLGSSTAARYRPEPPRQRRHPAAMRLGDSTTDRCQPAHRPQHNQSHRCAIKQSHHKQIPARITASREIPGGGATPQSHSGKIPDQCPSRRHTPRDRQSWQRQLAASDESAISPGSTAAKRWCLAAAGRPSTARRR